MLTSRLTTGKQESAFDDDSQEGIFDIIKAGVSLATEGVAAVAQHGFPILAGILAQAGGTEALETGNAETSFRGPLAQRALVADAALSTVLQVDRDKLQEAGFFDALTKAVKVIAPVVIKAAPIVAQNVLPIVGKILSGGGEDAPNPAKKPTPAKKPIVFSFGQDQTTPKNEQPSKGITSSFGNKDAGQPTRDPLENKQSDEKFWVRVNPKTGEQIGSNPPAGPNPQTNSGGAFP